MNPEACLPAELRGPGTTITSIADGLSGAGVYRVDAGGRTLVLKTSAPGEPLDAWRRRVHIQQLAADAGLAPRIVHVEEAGRAVVSEFVAGGTFFAAYGSPHTRAAAVALLGRTLRRVHDLPLPPDAQPVDPRAFLVRTWGAAREGMAIPAFVGEAVRRVLAMEEPARDRAPVLSHNDVHPANFVYDGERLLLLDWDTAGANEPYYDLANVSVFLRMDMPACEQLLSAYDGQPVSGLPERFAYDRQLMAVLCGANFLDIARQRGHPGGDVAMDATPSLGDIYQRMRASTFDIASAEGQWAFGLALVKEGIAAKG